MPKPHKAAFLAISITLLALLAGSPLWAANLKAIKERGLLRHLGIPYANFVTGSGDGLDVEVVQLFARHLGVDYEFVPTSWDAVIGDLTGKKVQCLGQDLKILNNVPIKGDLLASGFTVLPWRQRIMHFSQSTFPTQVWLIARADSPLRPIVPSGDPKKDIATVKRLLQGRTLLGKANTCLDPALYNLKAARARLILFPGGLNELAPAIINGEAELTLLDVPDALIALEKWPGKIKVIGPISPVQEMACAFAPDSLELLEAFNEFFAGLKNNGVYIGLVKKYYPNVLSYYPEFFQ